MLHQVAPLNERLLGVAQAQERQQDKTEILMRKIVNKNKSENENENVNTVYMGQVHLPIATASCGVQLELFALQMATAAFIADHQWKLLMDNTLNMRQVNCLGVFPFYKMV